MSTGLDYLKLGFQARQDVFSNISGTIPQFTHVASTKMFNGILMPMPPIDPTMELGSDWRELSTLQVLRENLPAVASQDRIKDSAGQLWKVVRREDNPGDFSVKLWVVKVVSGKDG